jgi:hypothetical protein
MLMSSTADQVTARSRATEPAPLRGFVVAVLLIAALSACEVSMGGMGDPSPDAAGATARDAGIDGPMPCVPPTPNTAPTYTTLYTTYFAVNTEGHCAKATCHGQPNYNVWLCGTDKDTCYNGMVGAGLISKTNPKSSSIADPSSSPLRWFNPQGAMPADRVRDFAQGRDAIKAWVAACAQNN